MNYSNRFSTIGRWAPSSRPQVRTTEPPSTKSLGLPIEQTLFDLEDLGTVLTPQARALHDELLEVNGSSSAAITTMMLATVSAATHCCVDVAYRDRVYPTSLFAFVIVPTGGQKSTVMNELIKAHQAFLNDEKTRAENPHDLAASISIWKAKLNKLNKECDEILEDEDALALWKKRYSLHSASKPQAGGHAANIFYTDITQEALVKYLDQAPCTSYINADASAALSTLNKFALRMTGLWSGEVVNRGRSSTPLIHQEHPRLAIAWGLHPRKFRKFILEYGMDFIDVGMGSRTLISDSKRTKSLGQGGRAKISDEARQRHQANLTKMFARYGKQLESGKIEREAFTLSSEAELQFDATLQWVEQNKNGAGYLKRVPEWTSRIAENILRIAANLHIIEGREGTQIALDVLKSAILLMVYYTEQHMTLFADINITAEEKCEQLVLKKVEHYHKKQCDQGHTYGPIITPVRWLQQNICFENSRLTHGQVIAACKGLEEAGMVYLKPNRRDIKGIQLRSDHRQPHGADRSSGE